MSYVDGFLLPVPVQKLPEYVKIAKKAGKIWLEHGALQYMECQGDDLEVPGMLSFNKVAKPKDGETIMFSFILYKNRKHRDQVNEIVMADPRLLAMCDPNNTPFDCKRMAYGGFKAIVEYLAKS
jgi:uncharacterized protein YbaA (DUF1428 family)